MAAVKNEFLQENELVTVSRDLKSEGVTRSEEYLKLCIMEVKEGKRIVFAAKTEEKTTAGISHLLLTSKYPGFREENIPEINDLIVVTKQRGEGIGAKLLYAQEEYAKDQGFHSIGLCVGLYGDFGPAQRLYAKSGYIPDGKGVVYDYQPAAPGEMVRLDDELNLCLIKFLR
ncbi:GNAT family N-acetyltransferase [Rossellomorea vietnamensis]|uniref:GNAT family N-acetyltransferase n=2 Tax=Rossellomorea TaxID=2837508 RepID=A0A5D4KG36_9BACI|nr:MULTISPECIES: GNAT family N-acetyltransferase [Rossellomorea]TYR75790.1 GNAT family N-acetyltransferase [Rossellomorea vietnamensis]TYS80999.1 GNAT family N-acetyltransferase [Rossellomorea aquimaris]